MTILPTVIAPAEVEIPFVFDWTSEWAFALGCAYTINDTDTIRAGYNYGKNPVPDENMYPLFPAIDDLQVSFPGLKGKPEPELKAFSPWIDLNPIFG